MLSPLRHQIVSSVLGPSRGQVLKNEECVKTGKKTTKEISVCFAGTEETLVTGVSDSVKPDTSAFACSLRSVSEYVACPGGDLSLDFQNSFSPQERRT